MKFITVFAVLLIACLSLAQNETGNGGDALTIQFRGTALNLSEAFERFPSACPYLARDELKERVNHTVVAGRQFVFEENEYRDAWNFPKAIRSPRSPVPSQDVILISRSRLVNPMPAKLFLTLNLHEYFGIMGIESTLDQTKSIECISALEYAIQGSDQTLESFVYSRSLLGTVESSLAEGRAHFRCTNEIGQVILYRSDRDPELLGADFSLTPLVRRSGVGTQACSPIHVQETYFVTTGLTEFGVSANCPDTATTLAAQIRLTSTDHLHWTGEMSVSRWSFFTVNLPRNSRLYCTVEY